MDPCTNAATRVRNTTELGDVLSGLRETARSYAEASLAESTRKAYQSDLEDFSLWCHVHELAALPASPETICLYLADLAERGRSPSTLQRRVAALKMAHRTGGHDPSPTDDVAVRQVMRGIRRKVGIAPRRQAAPLLVQQLRGILAANSEQTRRDVQEYALLLLGFASALRRSELVALDVEDLSFVEAGMLIRVRHSKTDQESAGETVAVPKGQHHETDPVVAVQRWLSQARHTTGPLWRAFDRWGNMDIGRMSDRTVARVLQRGAARAGMDVAHLSGHSLRAGFATSAAAAGASERSIAAQTRHKSMATLRRYIRLATAFDENAVSKVGL